MSGRGTPGVDLEVRLARVLQAGTYASIALVAAGTVLLIAGGGSPLAGGPPLDLSNLAPDVLAIRPAGVLWLGILGVIATPAVRVAAALAGFWRRGERRMAGVALAILAVVALGVASGVVSG